MMQEYSSCKYPPMVSWENAELTEIRRKARAA